MKPILLVSSMLVAGTLAGIAPGIPTYVKSALFQSGFPVSTGGGVDLQIGWPNSAKPLVLSKENDGYVGYLPLRNGSSDDQCVLIDAHVQATSGEMVETSIDPSRAFVITSGTSLIEKIELKPKLTVNTLPATGFVSINFDKVAKQSSGAACRFASTAAKHPLFQDIRLPERPIMGYVFLTPFVFAAVIVLITGCNSKIKLFHIMGSANWTFEKSWGANVTLGGALLITLIGLTIFPERPSLMNKSSYALLQILFAALVSLAPLTYNLIRREIEVNSGGVVRVESRGYVIMFLLSGGLVLWAALGQIVTVAVLVEEFISGGTLDCSTGRVLQGLAALLFLLLVLYGFRSLYQTAKNLSTTSADGNGTRPGPRAAAVGELNEPLTEWSIL